MAETSEQRNGRGARRAVGPMGLALGVALGLGGCSSIGDPIEAIGARAPAPDEFMVLPRQPLVVPPALAASDLPVPDPGRPSPLEPDPKTAAAVALMGPGAAAPQATAGEASAGEAALLGAARASSAAPEIRVQLDEDRLAAAEAETNAPYEPPTIGELLFGASEEEEEPADPAIVLDPIAESQRLQREGVATPNDPLARVPEEEAPRPRVQSQYDPTRDRRPQPPIVGQNTTPAFE